MKKKSTRLFALALCLLMLLPVASLSAQAAIIDLPIVYVQGKYAEVWNSDETQVLYPLNPPIANTIKDNAAAIFSLFQIGEKTGNWKPCADKVYDTIAPRYEAVMMDDNGDPRNGSHSKAVQIPEKNKTKKKSFWLHDYVFTYDSRLDPYDNARLLNDFIDTVLSLTGKKQVNLIGRCLGSTIISTYLTEYGCSNPDGSLKVKTCIFYAPAFNGVYVMDGFFTSDYDINYNRVQYYLKNGSQDEGGNYETIQNFADAIDKFGMFDWFLSSANNGIQNMKQYLFPRLTLAIFGTWPGHWAMISKDAFQKAKGTTLADTPENAAKYAGLIQRVERYQDNVMSKFPQTLEACRQKGMRVAIISKYNLPLPPLSPNSSMMADGTVELRTMSLGATAGNVGEQLSRDYIQNDLKDSGYMSSFVAEMRDQGKMIYLDENTNGTIKRSNYLSKDNMVDASTCQYPDYTWFIKNCPHAAYPAEINQLFLNIFRSPTQYTIYSDSNYPQFMAFDSEKNKIVEITTPQSGETPQQTASSSFFKRIADRIIEFCRKIMAFFGMNR